MEKYIYSIITGVLFISLIFIGDVYADENTQPVTADFSANITTGNAPLTIQFTDLSSGNIDSWSWSFGDREKSQEKNPVHTFQTPGKYSVTLIVSGVKGVDKKTRLEYITVSEPVKDNQAVTTTSPDIKDTPKDDTPVTQNGDITALDAHGAEEINENNSSGSVDEPNHSDTKDITADFSVENSDGLLPLKVVFSDNSSGPVKEWLWEFGDGTSSAAAAPVHIYQKAGTFNITLTVKSDTGEDTITKEGIIHAIKPVTAGFISNTTKGTAPYTASFVDKSTGDIVKREWSFGDGEVSSEASPTHEYKNPGTYDVKLTVYGTLNQDEILRPLLITVDKNISINETPTIVPTQSPSIEPTKTPEVIENKSPDTNLPTIISTPVPVTTTIPSLPQQSINSTPPSAAFNMDVSSGYAPLTVNFKDNSTGTIDRWNWIFGDETTSGMQDPKHEFKKPGSYSVSLFVAGPVGENKTDKSGCIKVLDPVDKNSIEINVTPDNGIVPINVTIKASSDISDKKYLWEFGDGKTSTDLSPEHQYTIPGEYQVSLTIIGEYGKNKTFSYDKLIEARSKAIPPLADFTQDSKNGGAPYTIQFTDLSTGEISGRTWDFGDGTNSSEKNPAHLYANPGIYTVTLTVKGPGGENCVTRDNLIMIGSVIENPIYTQTPTPLPTQIQTTIPTPQQEIVEIKQVPTQVQEISQVIVPEPVQSVETPKEIVTSEPESLTPVPNLTALPEDNIVISEEGYGNITESENISNYQNYSQEIPEIIPTEEPVPALVVSEFEVSEEEIISDANESVNNTSTIADIENITQELPEIIPTEEPVQTLVVSEFENITKEVNITVGEPFNNSSINTILEGQTPEIPVVIPTNPVKTEILPIVNATKKADNLTLKPFDIIITKEDNKTPCNVTLNSTWYLHNCNFNWDFGDGLSSNEKSPSHLYETPGVYIIRLVCDDKDGKYKSEKQVEIKSDENTTTEDKDKEIIEPQNKNPVELKISGAPTEGAQPLNVSFNSTWYNQDCEYQWNFGDKTTDTDKAPMHTYTSPGIYTVRLTCTDKTGRHVVENQNMITVSSVDSVPIAKFEAYNTSGKAPLTVLFTSKSKGTINEWDWNFGDGENGSGSITNHTYTKPGLYSVSLLVKGAKGTSVERKENFIQVLPPIEPLVAGFNMSSSSQTVPVSVWCKSTSKGNISRYLWEFGDGEVSEDINPTHRYTKAGTYIIRLKIYGEGGSSSADQKIVLNEPGTVKQSGYNEEMLASNVSDASLIAYHQNMTETKFTGLKSPVSNFYLTNNNGRAPLKVACTDRSTGLIDKWEWDFGDGGRSEEKNPDHVYTKSGIYTVSLSISGPAGISIKTMKDVVIVR